MELPSTVREKRVNRKDVLKDLEKATSSEYETHWDEGGRIVLKKKTNVKRGRKSKEKGSTFELRVRNDLEDMGWIVDKWSNNVDLREEKIIPAKRKFNPFSKVMAIGTGFPDFIIFQRLSVGRYNVIGVEVKVNGQLSKEEKQKCSFYLKNKIFSEIWVAKKKKEKNRVRVEYIDFEKIKNRMR